MCNIPPGIMSPGDICPIYLTSDIECKIFPLKIFDLPGVPKKSSCVFQLFSKNALSQNGKIGLGPNRFLNEVLFVRLLWILY